MVKLHCSSARVTKTEQHSVAERCHVANDQWHVVALLRRVLEGAALARGRGLEVSSALH